MTIEELRQRAAEVDKRQGTASRAGKRQMEVEHSVQEASVTWFRMQYPALSMLLFAVPNGTYIKGVKGMIAGQHRKAEGAVKGVSDLILLVPCRGYHGMCIEMKRDKNIDGTGQRGYQSKEQKEFQTAVEAKGYRYIVARSVEEFRREVNGYLGEAVTTAHMDGN